MNKISDAGAISRRIICSENLEIGSLALRGFNRQGNHMRFRRVPFPDAPVRVSTGSVEIAQNDRTKVLVRTNFFQNLLDDELARTIGVNRLLWVIFTDRDALRNPIGGAR